ncbi:MAG: peptidoglycan editing factor PgeF [Pseudomonadota bacterium]
MDAPPFIRAAQFSTLPRVRHGFFGRRGGVSDGIFESLNVGIGSGDHPASIRQNRIRVRSALDATAMVSPYQVHGAKAVRVTGPWPDDQRPQCDGLVTDQPNIGLCILTADCAPVLFADARNAIIGAAHAGWKGAIAGVCEATLDAMVKLGSRPSDITCVIGPAIQQPSYEVGPEFLDRFVVDDADNGMFFTPGQGDRVHFDLTRYIHHRLDRAHVGQIERVESDTYSDETYFSNRRRTRRGELDYGRNASVITLSPK